jgi:hypothetical protein
MRLRNRWAAIAGLLTLGALLSPSVVPLYDGVGFPDQPYRFVPKRGDTPAATSATVTLKVKDGVNAGGLLANSQELGPQVSVYAPPQAFALPSPSAVGDIRLTAEPVPLSPPAPPGSPVSNVYALSLTSPGGPVTVRSNAQKPGITLRAVDAKEPLPVMYYRSAPDQRWTELPTQQVGRDIFNSVAPGPGDYVLTRAGGSTRADSGGRTGLLLLVGLVVLVMVGVVVGVRVLSSRRPEAP